MIEEEGDSTPGAGVPGGAVAIPVRGKGGGPKWKPRGEYREYRELAQWLNDLMRSQKLTLRAMGRLLYCGKDKVRSNISGEKRPEWGFVEAFVRACLRDDPQGQEKALRRARQLWRAAEYPTRIEEDTSAELLSPERVAELKHAIEVAREQRERAERLADQQNRIIFRLTYLLGAFSVEISQLTSQLHAARRLEAAYRGAEQEIRRLTEIEAQRENVQEQLAEAQDKLAKIDALRSTAVSYGLHARRELRSYGELLDQDETAPVRDAGLPDAQMVIYQIEQDQQAVNEQAAVLTHELSGGQLHAIPASLEADCDAERTVGSADNLPTTPDDSSASRPSLTRRLVRRAYGLIVVAAFVAFLPLLFFWNEYALRNSAVPDVPLTYQSSNGPAPQAHGPSVEWQVLSQSSVDVTWEIPHPHGGEKYPAGELSLLGEGTDSRCKGTFDYTFYADGKPIGNDGLPHLGAVGTPYGTVVNRKPEHTQMKIPNGARTLRFIAHRSDWEPCTVKLRWNMIGLRVSKGSVDDKIRVFAEYFKGPDSDLEDYAQKASAPQSP